MSNSTGPGWANPKSGGFDDDGRVVGRDGRPYGPVPRDRARYRGVYHHGNDVIISYTVGKTDVLESPSVMFISPDPVVGDSAPEHEKNRAEVAVFARTFHIGSREQPLTLLVATSSGSDASLERLDNIAANEEAKKTAPNVRFGRSNKDRLLAGVVGTAQACDWKAMGNRLCLNIPAGSEPLRFTLWFTRAEDGRPVDSLQSAIPANVLNANLTARLAGGTARWPEILTTDVTLGASDGSFAVDVLTHPHSNPWLAQMRFTGIDFYPDGDRAVVCTWDGDVWLVGGLSKLGAAASSAGRGAKPRLTWQRIASGLFQPLGIKLFDGKVFVTCRDQLVILRDLNGDGETDFYECFNNDHQVTEHFHEFAMGLQVDDQGKFYYAKSARHALPAVVPHHGTLLRISADGSKTDILATGFRAANGVCLNPDGTFFVTDQEGHWTPKNRINWVREGGFYGNLFGYHDVKDSSDKAMEQPLCWITNEFDRSPAELLWTPRDAWGPLGGSLLNLSYGYGKVFVVPFEEIDGEKQGGMCALPIPSLPTGVMRGRFHPHDRQLYCCGMFAWAGSATQPGGLYRIRYTGRPMMMPKTLAARKGQLDITFTDPLNREAARNPANYSVKTWSLKRSADYGSKHIDEKPLEVQAAALSDDGRTVSLKLPNLSATWGMEIICRLKGEDGKPFERVIQNSIFKLGDTGAP